MLQGQKDNTPQHGPYHNVALPGLEAPNYETEDSGGSVDPLLESEFLAYVNENAAVRALYADNPLQIRRYWAERNRLSTLEGYAPPHLQESALELLKHLRCVIRPYLEHIAEEGRHQSSSAKKPTVDDLAILELDLCLILETEFARGQLKKHCEKLRVQLGELLDPFEDKLKTIIYGILPRLRCKTDGPKTEVLSDILSDSADKQMHIISGCINSMQRFQGNCHALALGAPFTLPDGSFPVTSGSFQALPDKNLNADKLKLLKEGYNVSDRACSFDALSQALKLDLPVIPESGKKKEKIAGQIEDLKATLKRLSAGHDQGENRLSRLAITLNIASQLKQTFKSCRICAHLEEAILSATIEVSDHYCVKHRKAFQILTPYKFKDGLFDQALGSKYALVAPVAAVLGIRAAISAASMPSTEDIANTGRGIFFITMLEIAGITTLTGTIVPILIVVGAVSIYTTGLIACPFLNAERRLRWFLQRKELNEMGCEISVATQRNMMRALWDHSNPESHWDKVFHNRSY